MREPEPEKRTVPTITLEPEPYKESAHVCEPAPLCIAVECLVEYEGMEKDPAHHPSVGGKLKFDYVEFRVPCVLVIVVSAQF